MAETPIEVAIAVVEHLGRFLIGQRPLHAALAGYWEFPGGKIEAGETPAAAAIRECREEAGLDVQVRGLFQLVDHRYGHGLLRVHFLDCSPINPKATPTAPFRWVARADLGQYRFPEANAALLEQLAKAGS